MTLLGPRFIGDTPAQAALEALGAALQQRHRGDVQCLLFYGSCLRSGDLFEGLVDLWVVVRDYRSAHPSRLAALANRALPPNVYYLQLPLHGRIVRCKYAVFSAAQLAERAAPGCLESYVWGRLCQPVAIAWAADDAALEGARAVLREAARSFLLAVLPCVPACGTLTQLWECGLQLSYATELRTEGGGRAAELVTHGSAHYAALTRELAPELQPGLRLDGDTYATAFDAAERHRALGRWRRRRVQGKLLSVLRLLKALFTFEGGLDYIAWKLERHSGRRVEIPERVRRWPLLFVWGLMWRLYREGFFK
jgi:hypothetical protein